MENRSGRGARLRIVTPRLPLDRAVLRLLRWEDSRYLLRQSPWPSRALPQQDPATGAFGRSDAHIELRLRSSNAFYVAWQKLLYRIDPSPR